MLLSNAVVGDQNRLSLTSSRLLFWCLQTMLYNTNNISGPLCSASLGTLAALCLVPDHSALARTLSELRATHPQQMWSSPRRLATRGGVCDPLRRRSL